MHDAWPECDVALAAGCDVPVLITSGSKLDRVAWARAIHDGSARCSGPCIVVVTGPAAAAGTSDALTLIDDRHAGLTLRRAFECADGGTLFIDRVEDMGRADQRRLQALLGAGAGSNGRAVRIVTGTAESLHHRITAGTFLEALFYRLNAIHVNVSIPEPTLR